MKFDLNKLTEREKKLIGILLIIGASIPFFIQTLPSWREYTSSKKQIVNDKSRLKQMGSQISKLEKLQNENKKLVKKIDNQKKFLAKSQELDFLAQDLKRICDESSVSLESFTPSGIEPVNIILEKQIDEETQGKARGYKTAQSIKEKLKGQDLPVDLYRLPIEVKIKGNFIDIVDLFKKLEKYGRVISVENISIGKVESKGSSDRYSKTMASIKETGRTSLFSSFDLVAYSSPKEEESLPFSSLEKSAKSTFKFKSSKKR